MPTEVLLTALQKAGVVCDENAAPSPCPAEPITRADFFRAGLSGGENSASRRAALLAYLGLPAHMTTKALLGVINDYMTREAFEAFFRDGK